MKKLGRLQEEIVTIINELEMYIPPAFFDIMVHLLVHIVDVSRISGLHSCTT
jgi:hypothetical protein